jgi:uncharacterized membrane protein YfcA
MSTLQFLFFYLVMGAVATGFSALGQGGGVLYTPIQTWFGVNFHVAATTSLFLIMVMSLSAWPVYRHADRIDWPLAFAMESASAAGGFAGGITAERFPVVALELLLAGVMVLASVFMIRGFRASRRRGRSRDGGGLLAWRRSVHGRNYEVNMAVALPAAFAAGVASGLVGVGGGVLKVPAMVLLLGVPMDVAVGSSAFMVGTTAAGGFAGHALRGHWDWRVSLILGAVVFVGGQVGSRLSLRLSTGRLQRIFGWVLLAAAALVVARAVR